VVKRYGSSNLQIDSYNHFVDSIPNVVNTLGKFKIIFGIRTNPTGRIQETITYEFQLKCQNVDALRP
jgi:DNA-directed RNA polymerase II subunit RPB2